MSFEYVNARLRAMKGLLLSEAAIEQLVKARSFEEFKDSLASLPGYGEALAGTQNRFQGLEAVEWALKEDLSSTARKIRMMAQLSGDGKGSSSPFFWDKDRQYLPKDEKEGENISTLVDVLIQKWDLFNVKTLLRGKYSHTDPRELGMSLLPVGKLGQGPLQSLAQARDVKEVFDYLITWQVDYAKPLREGLRSYVERKDLVVSELYLDRYYFEKGLHLSLGENGEKSLKQILETQIDNANIITALRETRSKTNGSSPSFFIAGGRLSIDFLRSLLTQKTTEGVMEKLAETPYKEALQGAIALFTEKGDLSVVEKKLEQMLMRKAVRMYTRDPLGLGILIGYLWMKVAEVTNLKVLASGHFYKMPEHAIRERLVQVAA